VRVFGGYLPLSGGTLTGSLTMATGFNIMGSSTSVVSGFANYIATAAGAHYWVTRAVMRSPADGSVRLSNNAESGFTSLLFATGAGTDIGTYVGAGSPEGAVTARIGSTYCRTDGGAATSFYVKESGTGNTGWVAK